MRVEVEVLGRDKKVLEISEGHTLGDIARIINIRRVEYVPSVNNKIVTWEYKVRDGDIVKFIPVVSGGYPI